MTWAIAASLIEKYGLPFAEAVYKKWASGSAPTQADFDQLRAMEQQTSSDRLKAALARAGIPLDDPKAVALLAQIQ